MILSRRRRHAWLGEIGVGQADVLGRRMAEHHIELRVPEDERVARLDQRDAGVVAERVGEDRRELEPAETGAENENALSRREPNGAMPVVAPRIDADRGSAG